MVTVNDAASAFIRDVVDRAQSIAETTGSCKGITHDHVLAALTELGAPEGVVEEARDMAEAVQGSAKEKVQLLMNWCIEPPTRLHGHCFIVTIAGADQEAKARPKIDGG